VPPSLPSQASQSPQLSISSPSLSLSILAAALVLALADLAARAVLAVLCCPCYPRCPCSSICPHYTYLHCAGLLLLLLCRQSAYCPLPGACVYKRALPRLCFLLILLLALTPTGRMASQTRDPNMEHQILSFSTTFSAAPQIARLCVYLH
jgi:hypothetical protein